MESRSSEITSIKYHDIFDYKLTKEELVKWQYKTFKETTNGLKNKSRIKREKYSKEKLKIAKRAANLISKIPTVKFIGITGALAMNNAGKNSDIDLMIITSQGTLWLTRLFAYFVLRIMNYELRKPKNPKQKNLLCLNMWLDESNLVWSKNDRNIYTAHEIAQIVPLINKNKTYEKFLYLNRWILSFWPNAVKVPYAISNKPYGKVTINHKTYSIEQLLEKLAFKLQYFYMSRKITREVVTPTRAIFHPNDWGKVVLDKLSS